MRTKHAYTILEAAKEIGCGRTKLFQLIQSGRLKARKLDGRNIVLATELEQFLNSLPEAA